MTVDEQISAGFAHHQAGRLAEAESIYRQILARQPDHLEALHLLGALCLQTDRNEAAVELIRRLVQLKPDAAQQHYNLGLALTKLGRHEEAAEAARQAAKLQPNLDDAHILLGNAFMQIGKAEEAIAAYGKAIALRPTYAEAHFTLGNALKSAGQLDKAMTAYSKAIELKPTWINPHFALGQLFQEQQRFDDAAIVFRQAVRCAPDNAQAHNGLAIALADLKLLDEASKAVDRATALAPDSALTHAARGAILLRAGHGEKAVECFRRVVEIDPNWATGWINLGNALRHTGHFAEAAQCVPKILALRPGAVEAYTIMAGAGAGADSAEMERLASIVEDNRMPIGERATLGFVLGKALDEADRFDEAFAQYARANRLMLQMRHDTGERYSSEEFGRLVDELIAKFTPDFFSRSQGWGEYSEIPVFIVGMPRSGTTLVEQIAASHPDVFGAGELSEIGKIANSLGELQYHAGPINAAAREHLERLRAMSPKALRVIDKMPENVVHLGLIALMFPRSRIIFCRRDPRDTCLSCYFQRFTKGNQFTFDLAECGRHHVHTDGLIAHWLKVLPLRMIEVQYEEVVADLEGQSRRIIDFLGLPWNPACLDFHKTERTVQTASSWQVRQPIYTRSMGRWKNYERHLGMLFEALSLEK
jgi:tetratricopeptide (TPR) repeat protein